MGPPGCWLLLLLMMMMTVVVMMMMTVVMMVMAGGCWRRLLLLLLLLLAAGGCWRRLAAAGCWLLAVLLQPQPASHQPCQVIGLAARRAVISPGSFSHTAPLPAPPAGSDGRHDQAHGH